MLPGGNVVGIPRLAAKNTKKNITNITAPIILVSFDFLGIKRLVDSYITSH
jgi:hypothetical protein